MLPEEVDRKVEENGGKDEVPISTVKEESAVIMVDDEEQANSGCGGDGECTVVSKPIEGVREMEPSPFLKKTYEMVDDPSTDATISWGSMSDSFIVWDPHKFSSDFLPKHFKHNNFSSFVRQLNTYRFRKINSDRWEFANEGFQRGKKNLLKHIKRRKKKSEITPQDGAEQSWSSVTKNGVEDELEKLRTDQYVLNAEITQLRQQQANMETHLAAVKDRLQDTEMKQKHTLMFMIEALKNPGVFAQCIEKMRKKRALMTSGEILKKQRLAASDTKRLQVREALTTIQSEIQTLFSSEKSNSSNLSSEILVLWEKLVEDDMMYNMDVAEEEVERKQSNMEMEMEGLLAMPHHKKKGLVAPVSTA